MITLGNLIGSSFNDEFSEFDLTEIQNVLQNLQSIEPFDLSHAELLQIQSLRGADLISEYLGKLIKLSSYLESKINSTKNKVALDFKGDGKTTADQRRYAGESCPEVEEFSIQLAKIKGSRSLLEKKYEILIKSHHYFKDIANGYRMNMSANHKNRGGNEPAPEGWG